MILDGSKKSFTSALLDIDLFGVISGLRLNNKKTEILWIGASAGRRHFVKHGLDWICKTWNVSINPPFSNPCFTNPPFTNPVLQIYLLQIHVLQIHLLQIHVLQIHLLQIHVLQIQSSRLLQYALGVKINYAPTKIKNGLQTNLRPLA